MLKFIVVLCCVILGACASAPVRTFGSVDDASPDTSPALEVATDASPASEVADSGPTVVDVVPVESLALDPDMRNWTVAPLSGSIITGYCSMGTCASVQSKNSYVLIAPTPVSLVAADYVVSFVLKNETTTCTVALTVDGVALGEPQLFDMADYRPVSAKISVKSALSGRFKVTVSITDAGYINPVDVGTFRIVRL